MLMNSTAHQHLPPNQPDPERLHCRVCSSSCIVCGVCKGPGRWPGHPKRRCASKRRLQAHPSDTASLPTTARCKHTWILLVHGLVDLPMRFVIGIWRLIKETLEILLHRIPVKPSD